MSQQPTILINASLTLAEVRKPLNNLMPTGYHLSIEEEVLKASVSHSHARHQPVQSLAVRVHQRSSHAARAGRTTIQGSRPDLNNLVLGTEVLRMRTERPMDDMQRKVEKHACIGGVNVVGDLEY